MTEGANNPQENSLPIPSLGRIKMTGEEIPLLSRDPDSALGTPTQGEDLAPPGSLGLSGRLATLPNVARGS